MLSAGNDALSGDVFASFSLKEDASRALPECKSSFPAGLMLLPKMNALEKCD
jgi:hypothetical protein